MAVQFAVRLTPRGGRDGVDGVGQDGSLRIRVAAPPVDGAANLALIRLLAGELHIAASAVRIEAGLGSRMKRVSVDGASGADLSRRWPGLRVTEDR